MDFAEQRTLGVDLAKGAGADKTASTIENEQACYRDIFTAAVAEIGMDAFVASVIQGPPDWAHEALLHVPDLGSHSDALLRKAAETPETALATLRFASDLGVHRDKLVNAAGKLAQPLGNISAFSLLDAAGFDCKFTMWWVNEGKIQPSAGTSNEDEWKWSPLLELNLTNRTEMACSEFALAKSPLQAGNEVWMYVYVYGGYDVQSPLHFTYDPNTAQKALFTISGTTTKSSLAFNNFG